MSKTPYVGFSNDELDRCREVQDQEKCPQCGELHSVQYGAVTRRDGESRLLAFIYCTEGEVGTVSTFLVGINGKYIGDR